MSKTICIIDDHADDLTTMKQILEKEKYKVDTLTNGTEVLKDLDVSKYNIVLVDVRMPSLTAHGLLELLEQRDKYSIPLVFVSMLEKNEELFNYANGFIQKPFSVDKFKKSVQDFSKKVMK